MASSDDKKSSPVAKVSGSDRGNVEPVAPFGGDTGSSDDSSNEDDPDHLDDLKLTGVGDDDKESSITDAADQAENLRWSGLTVSIAKAR